MMIKINIYIFYIKVNQLLEHMFNMIYKIYYFSKSKIIKFIIYLQKIEKYLMNYLDHILSIKLLTELK